MANAKLQTGRPLSPHLQIYRPMLTMMMSIAHRITGAALYFGTLALAWWLIAAATGPEYFNFVNGLAGTLIGKLLLFGYTWALIHHMIGGIRHFIWDTGRGFDLSVVEFMARASLAASLGLTVLIWAIALIAPGGL
ncbi:succinate dehydrogenase cytochrome b556 subunit [bacterium BMS3Bbin10]|nr:succinate dehydrogenase cytochrome b556 subunit [bacterium BMS3Bbin10]